MVSSKYPCFATKLQSRLKNTWYYVEFSFNFSEILTEPHFNSGILSGRGCMEKQMRFVERVTKK